MLRSVGPRSRSEFRPSTAGSWLAMSPLWDTLVSPGKQGPSDLTGSSREPPWGGQHDRAKVFSWLSRLPAQEAPPPAGLSGWDGRRDGPSTHTPNPSTRGPTEAAWPGLGVNPDPATHRVWGLSVVLQATVLSTRTRGVSRLPVRLPMRLCAVPSPAPGPGRSAIITPKEAPEAIL